MAKGFSLTAFLWIQNLLDANNEITVWPTTGAPDNDGWLSTGEGENSLQTQETRICGAGCDWAVTDLVETLYQFRQNSPWHYGIPRMTRLGFRADF